MSQENEKLDNAPAQPDHTSDPEQKNLSSATDSAFERLCHDITAHLSKKSSNVRRHHEIPMEEVLRLLGKRYNQPATREQFMRELEKVMADTGIARPDLEQWAEEVLTQQLPPDENVIKRLAAGLKPRKPVPVSERHGSDLHIDDLDEWVGDAPGREWHDEERGGRSEKVAEALTAEVDEGPNEDVEGRSNGNNEQQDGSWNPSKLKQRHFSLLAERKKTLNSGPKPTGPARA